MFCEKCGQEMKSGARFCSSCGTPIRVTSENIVQTGETQVQSVNTEKQKVKKEESSKKKGMIKKLEILLFVIVIIIGGICVVHKLYVMHAEKVAYEQRQQRLKTIERTLMELGSYNRTYGSEDINTVQYSMALSLLEGAFIEEHVGSYENSGYDGTKKEYYFDKLTDYFERDYQMGITVLLFGYDYLEKEDVDYFFTGEMVPAPYLKEEFIDALVENHLNFNTFLISKKDREICNNMSLKIRLAEDGYVEIDRIYSELIDFVYSDEALGTLTTSLLENEAEYEDITADMRESFAGSNVYFDELTTSGKLVFLYMMPQFLAQCSEEGQEMGLVLWNIFYADVFDQIWQQMISDGIFVEVIAY